MELLEREPLLATLGRWLDEAAAGAGRMVAVAGEAGAGKSSLVSAFLAAHAGAVRIRSGACDPLSTARPLDALQDMAAAGGALADAIAAGQPPGELFSMLLAELATGDVATVVVVEDAQWADEATLDLVRFLGRRIGGVRALLLVTYRDDECGPDHPLRTALGDLAGASAVRRLHVPRLSQEAVARIAAEHDLDAATLYRTTGGNAFFVSEVVAAAPQAMPDTVRDAVLARANRLSDTGRALLDLVSVAPSRMERALLADTVGAALPGLDECLAAGVLVEDGEEVRFRHELARLAVDGSLPLGRRTELNRRLLDALRETSPPADPARLAHHAAAAGDPDAVVQYARAAGERAASLGAHREAAAHYAAVLAQAKGLTPAARAELLERRSYECYLTDQLSAAAEAREEALELWRGDGDTVRVGDTLRWLSRLNWFLARNDEAREAGRMAVEVLEREPPGRELAMAYSNRAQLAMLADDTRAAVDWGTRAVRLGEEIGDDEVVIHALNNVGTARARQDDPAGFALLERSLAMALEGGLEEHVARAYTNLMVTAVDWRDVAAAQRYGDAGIEYCTDRDLDSWRLYMTGWRARLALLLDDWDGAAAAAGEVLRHRGVAPVTSINALAVLGRVRARRGDPEVAVVLDEALELARRTGEVQRLAPVAIARAEAAWLGAAAAPAELPEVLAMLPGTGDPWTAGELAVWARRLGVAAPGAVAAPHRDMPYLKSLAGAAADAAASWLARGCRYEAALAAIDGDDPGLLRSAMEWLRAQGAAAVVPRVASRLQELGFAAIRGPRAATSANPAGLTARELQVLTLLTDGLSNAQIAERLVVSARTVDHHVSAVLRKLGVGSRLDAARTASRLGIGAAQAGQS